MIQGDEEVQSLFCFFCAIHHHFQTTMTTMATSSQGGQKHYVLNLIPILVNMVSLELFEAISLNLAQMHTWI